MATTLTESLNILAGTSGEEAIVAANTLAGLTGQPLIVALNEINGTAATPLPFRAVCNALAGTTNMDGTGALSVLAESGPYNSVPLSLAPSLWLRASSIDLADAAEITTWADESGNGNDATGAGATKPTLRTAVTPAGGKVVRFQAIGYFTLPDFMTGETAGEIFAVLKRNADNNGLWAFGADTANTDESHFTFGGVVYEMFGKASGDRSSFTPSVDVTTAFRRYNVRSAAGAFRSYLDTVAQHAEDATNTVTWTANPRLGMGRKNSVNDLPFSGDIAEVLVFPRILSTEERDSVDAYLVATHGL